MTQYVHVTVTCCVAVFLLLHPTQCVSSKTGSSQTILSLNPQSLGLCDV